jgi:hypothetical protein
MWRVWPHGRTVTPFLESNRYFAEHERKLLIKLSDDNIKTYQLKHCKQIKYVQNRKNSAKGKKERRKTHLKANRAVMMHCFFYTWMTIHQYCRITTTYIHIINLIHQKIQAKL